MPKAYGTIPEKITYVCAPEIEVRVGCRWDMSYTDDGKYAKEKVLPAFPVDPTNDKTMKTAVAWAERPGYDYNTRQHIPHTHTAHETTNKPIKNVRVLSLEERGNGGRAYKVMIGKFYVDLREDVLMDVLLQVGVSPGGILSGEYIWAKIGTSMKLIRVGSELHSMVVATDAKKDFKPLAKNELQVGGVYQDKKSNTAIFIGYINTTMYAVERRVGGWNDSSKPTFNYEHTPIRKAMLFYKVYDFKGIKKTVEEIKSKDSMYQFEIKKTHTYVEKVQDIELPENLIGFIREKALKDIKNQVLEYTGHKAPKQNYSKIDAWTLSNNISYHSDHLNLYPYEGTPVELFDVKKLLLFS